MKIYTTGQAAKICSVAPRTISKWFDTGKLGGYRLPDSRDRRIPENVLLKFMQDNGIPTDKLDAEVTNRYTGVISISSESAMQLCKTAAASQVNGCNLILAPTVFDVGTSSAKFDLDFAILEPRAFDNGTLYESLKKDHPDIYLVLVAVLFENMEAYPLADIFTDSPETPEEAAKLINMACTRLQP